MNNSNLSEMVLDSQSQLIDSIECELDETALDSINGGDISDRAGGDARDVGRVIGDIASAPFKIAVGGVEGFIEGFFG